MIHRSRLHLALLSLVTGLYFYSPAISAEEWFIGLWEPDRNQHTIYMSMTDTEIKEFQIEVPEFKILHDRFQLEIDESNISYRLAGTTRTKDPYHTEVSEDGSIKFHTSNVFGDILSVVWKTDSGFCMQHTIQRDRWGAYEPPKPMIDCYVPIRD